MDILDVVNVVDIYDLMIIFADLVPIGFLLGCLPMVIGYAISFMISIFKRI